MDSITFQYTYGLITNLTKKLKILKVLDVFTMLRLLYNND